MIAAKFSDVCSYFIFIPRRYIISIIKNTWKVSKEFFDFILKITDSKSSYDDGLFHHHCVFIKPQITAPETDEYLSSDEWGERNKILFMMHEAVNKSIDLTIQKIGQDKFDKALSEHRYLQSLVQRRCAPTAIYPCSDEGVFQEKLSNANCYESDFGCGYPCIDELYNNITKRNMTY